MTQIFFYHNAPDRIAATAALIGKAFAQKKALLVYAPDQVVGRNEDERLAGRLRVKHYKDHGYEVSFKDLAEKS